MPSTFWCYAILMLLHHHFFLLVFYSHHFDFVNSCIFNKAHSRNFGRTKTLIKCNVRGHSQMLSCKLIQIPGIFFQIFCQPEANLLPLQNLGIVPVFVIITHAQKEAMCKLWLCLALQASSHLSAGCMFIV